MYDFKNVKATHKLNRDFVLSKISDSMIFGYYFGPFKLNQIYCSRLRKEKNPSVGFYLSSSGKIIHNDFSTGKKLDAFAYVQELYSLSFADAVKRIAKDFGLVSGERSAAADKVMLDMRNFEKKQKEDTLIHFEAGRWTDHSLEFWKNYHITKDELKHAKIYPISKLYINEQFIPNKSSIPRYALTTMHKGEMKTKVYSPGSDGLKWISNIPNDVPFGLDELQCDTENCFIAKAQKDRLILRKFLPDVIASQNENAFSINEKLASDLQFEYSRVFVGWDNDWPGLRGMVKMRQRDFIPLYVPVKLRIEEGIKDFSDLAKAKGLKAVEKLLKQNGVI